MSEERRSFRSLWRWCTMPSHEGSAVISLSGFSFLCFGFKCNSVMMNIFFPSIIQHPMPFDAGLTPQCLSLPGQQLWIAVVSTHSKRSRTLMSCPINDILPPKVFTPAVLTAYLGSTDSRDKLVKGVGSIFKITMAMTGNPHHGKMAASCSDARSIMRLAVWVNNIQKLEAALSAQEITPRGALFIIRVLLDGIFSSLDNIAFIGNFFHPKNPGLKRVSNIGRGALFWGYVFAVIVDVMDLSKTEGCKNKVNKALTLTRNACDMISTVGNVFPVDIGATNGAMLAVISSVIATREQLMIAYDKQKKVKSA
eukprot:gene4340-3154_t